ncbi:hypothetical protein COU75_02930 [Candidatus Peregrinibacteria bacterium CG10_big_fil_rev_8_21_14_0_10_42_8]|nr:MAG: hypothetical protein COU75_02930 [Candidatus Peregrinibacteria bacterium CG10_big_fil_rev_8_21_14_0_10_42_8]
MALQDILAAITADADRQIELARAAHQKELTAMREESERTIAKRKQEIAVQKQQKIAQLTAKAETHAASHKRNALLTQKKEVLDVIYALAVEELCKLPDSDAETLFRECLKKIKGKGEIHPSKKHADLLKKICPSEQFRMKDPIHAKGGFLFISDKEEQDFTFENLIENTLRPRTELTIAHTLFV